MTIKKLMMGAGAVDGPQVIAPSSNDWNYTYSQNEWPFAGNSLGDGTLGGYVDNVGGDSGITSLHTFDGDFEIEATHTHVGGLTTAVFEIEDDDGFDASSDGNTTLRTMSNCWSWQSGTGNSWTGHASGSFVHNNTGEGTPVNAVNGSVIKWERVGGQITVYDDGVSKRAFATTSTKPLRFAIVAPGVTSGDIDNILYTDSAKIQRDGFFNETAGTSRGWGGSGTERYYGFGFQATRTGTIETVKGQVDGHTANFASTAGLYPDSAGSPGSQIGSDSNTQTINGNATFTWTFASEPSVEKGRWYWMVFSDTDGGSGNTNFKTIGNYGDALFRSGKAGAIGSITDHASHGDLKVEIKINATEEPTPDHETLLLIQDEGSNGSQTFTDSSQLGLTCTANNQVHWDNVQNLGYGTTAIYVDGSDDHISLADHDRWSFPGDFTIDLILRCTDVSSKRQIYEHRTSGATSGHGFNLQIDTGAVLQFFANASGGAISALCGAISNNTNHHVCAVRSGNRLGLALDGTFGTVVTLTGAINNVSTTLKFGSGVHSIGDFVGWMKRIRITNDARWEPGVNFTPPTGNYPVG